MVRDVYGVMCKVMTKKSLIKVALLAAAVMITACSKGKNEPKAPVQVKTYQMSVSASFSSENGAAKGPRKALVLDGSTLKAKWDGSERVTVYNVTKSAAFEGQLAPDGHGEDTNLEGNLTGVVEESDELFFKLCAPNYTGQDGTLAYIAANCDYATASGTADLITVPGKIRLHEPTLAFVSQQCIMKLTLSDGSSAISPTAMTINDGTSDIATLAIPAETYTTNGAGIVFVAIPAVESKALTFTATSGGSNYTFTSPVISLTNGKYYAQSITMSEYAGALTGAFSVSSTKQVYFAKGNLQAVYPTQWSHTWQFAANQWTYVGNAAANTSVNSNTAGVSATGTVDLFGWSTDTYYGIKNSTDDGDYSGDFADWGAVIGSGWRTLSKDEWDYLLNTRTNANTKQSRGTVNSVKGFILLPDSWSLPAGLNFSARAGSWDTNSYSGGDWTAMENNGAVFLPCAGKRSGTTVSEVDSEGYYWTSEYSGSTDGYRIKLTASGYDAGSRHYGHSVRLVIDAN